MAQGKLCQADAALFIRLYADACTLVNQQHIPILVNHVNSAGILLHTVYLHHVPCHDPFILLHTDAVQLHIPAAEALLPYRCRQFRQKAAEAGVNALPFRRLINLKFVASHLLHHCGRHAAPSRCLPLHCLHTRQHFLGGLYHQQ